MIKKIVFGVVLLLFLMGIGGTTYAEPAVALPTAPVITTTPPMSQPPIPGTNQQTKPGQKLPATTPPVVPEPPPENPNPGSGIPYNPQLSNQPGFNPGSVPVAPPTMPTPPAENPVKNYQTAWFTSPLFLMAAVILHVILILVFYSLREGKAPSEEKEETSISKKKKTNKK
jgi:hypothetical protein